MHKLVSMAWYSQYPNSKHQNNPDLLLHLHLQRPHLRSRQVKHPKVQRNIDRRMRPRKRINIKTSPLVLAVPRLPKEAHGPALEKIRHDEAAHQEQVERLRGPDHAAELWVREQPQVQEQYRSLDQAEGERVEHLKHEEDLEELGDAPGLEGPDVAAQAVALLEDAAREPSACEELCVVYDLSA